MSIGSGTRPCARRASGAASRDSRDLSRISRFASSRAKIELSGDGDSSSRARLGAGAREGGEAAGDQRSAGSCRSARGWP